MKKFLPLGASLDLNLAKAPLDVVCGDSLISYCWEFSFVQRLRLLVTGKIFLFIRLKGITRDAAKAFTKV